MEQAKQIVPTITAATPDEYAREFEKLTFAPRIHVDITDGKFAPSETVNLNQVYFDATRKWDLHLMMNAPQNWLHQVISLGPELAIFHAEIPDARAILPKIRDHLAKFQIKFGVALLPETAPADFREIVENADSVLIFGGHLGYQGGTADLSQLKKAAEIREIWHAAGVDESAREISWDGGANADNAEQIFSSGVDVLNVGGAIAKTENPREAYGALEGIAKKLR